MTLMDKYNELLPTVKEAMGITDMDDTHAKAYATDEELIDLLRRNDGDVGEMFRPVVEVKITFKSENKTSLVDRQTDDQGGRCADPLTSGLLDH